MFDADDYAGLAAARAPELVVIENGKTYELLAHGESLDRGDPYLCALAIRCKQCDLTSHQPMDVQKLYCGFCHRFHERSHAHPA